MLITDAGIAVAVLLARSEARHHAQHPRPAHVAVSRSENRTPLPSPTTVHLTGVEGCIAWNESRDEPQVVNPTSGAGGLFQFEPSTWQAMGFAQQFGVPVANEATVAQQELAFEETVQRVGYSPWTGDPCVG